MRPVLRETAKGGVDSSSARILRLRLRLRRAPQ
jgi:hypothetical protein